MVELALVISVLINWWQWGETETAKLERDLAREQSQLCQEAREDARGINRDNADQREAQDDSIRRIVLGTKLDFGHADQVGDADLGDDRSGVVVCVDRADSARGERMAKVIERTNRINQALRSPGTLTHQKTNTGATTYPALTCRQEVEWLHTYVEDLQIGYADVVADRNDVISLCK